MIFKTTLVFKKQLAAKFEASPKREQRTNLGSLKGIVSICTTVLFCELIDTTIVVFILFLELNLLYTRRGNFLRFE